MARRGKYPPRVAKHLRLFRMMQLLIDTGMAPNEAAVLLARKHWKETSESYEACVWWLKYNERMFRDDLRRQFLRECESGVPCSWANDDDAVKKIVREYMHKHYPKQMRSLEMFLTADS